MKTLTLNLKETLAALASEHGMAAVLATVRNLLAAEVDELIEMDNDEDRETADKVDAIASDVLTAAQAYSRL